MVTSQKNAPVRIVRACVCKTRRRNATHLAVQPTQPASGVVPGWQQVRALWGDEIKGPAAAVFAKSPQGRAAAVCTEALLPLGVKVLLALRGRRFISRRGRV